MSNKKTFDEIYDEIIDDLRGNLTSDEYKELISLEYCLTWGYTTINDDERYNELIIKKYEHVR